MATEGNERYLRYILLLGEGILLVLRSIVRREVVRTGSTLETILTISNNRNMLESSCSSHTQRLLLYPSGSTVNSDINTWDISLLTLVLQRVFWSNLSRDERLRICYLRDCRNEFQGHPPTMSMHETDYTTRSADLMNVLQDLTSSLDQHTKDELTRIINNSNSVHLDIHTAIESLQKLYEFKEEMLKELENKFQTVNTRLDNIQDESTDHRQMTRDISAIQCHMHGDILDTKSLAEENNRMAKTSSKTLDDLQSAVSSSMESDEHDRDKLRHIEQMMEELLSRHRGFQHDIDTNINIDSDTSENAAEAQDLIFTTINDILKRTRPDVMGDRDNAEAIMERVNELLLGVEGNDYELTTALLELIQDIIRHGDVTRVRKGSIKLTVRFKSYKGVLQFMQYLNSHKFQDRLNDISRALKNRTGHSVILSANIAPECLYDLHKHLTEECKKLKWTRTVVLPVRCKGIIELNHIWALLQKGGADNHMKRVSEILTKIVGGSVSVTTSVNLSQFEQALLKTDSASRHSEMSMGVLKRFLGTKKRGLDIDSGCFSADSRMFSTASVTSVISDAYPEEDNIPTNRTAAAHHHEDTSADNLNNDDESFC